MAGISRPAIYGGLACLCAAAFWWSSTNSANAARSGETKPQQRKSPGQEWTFPESESSLRFDKPKKALRNVFHALIVAESSAPRAEEEELTKLPAAFADGEGDWAYTGMVEINSVRLALLENASNHQGGYVREGETWKKSRIVSIALSSIVVEGPDGTQKTVFRYNANQTPKPKPQPDPGFRPFDISPALKGPIGIQIQDESKSSSSTAVPKDDRKSKQ